MKLIPKARYVNTRIAVFRRTLSLLHDCLGEQVTVQSISKWQGRVVNSDLCPLDPASGCDGVPLYKPGDLIRLPEDWEGCLERPRDLFDVEKDSPRNLEVAHVL